MTSKSKQRKDEKTNLDEVIGRNIRNERQSRNLSREELAEMLELTTSHMGLIERGERGATAITLAKLTRVLHLPIDAFFMTPAKQSLREERSTSRAANEKKITSLLTNLSDVELAFIVHVIQGVAKLSSALREEED